MNAADAEAARRMPAHAATCYPDDDRDPYVGCRCGATYWPAGFRAGAAWQAERDGLERDHVRDVLRARIADLAADVAALRAERNEWRDTAAEYAPILDRLGALLDRVALALRGKPPPLTSWGYADLPERAAALVADLERARHVVSSGYGCEACAWDDLREALGLEARRTPHEHL